MAKPDPRLYALARLFTAGVMLDIIRGAGDERFVAEHKGGGKRRPIERRLVEWYPMALVAAVRGQLDEISKGLT